ncbi:MAG: DUF2783 domain-containing protein [Gammaproteobacteria bacterium]|nr:DUF2783 domain-containing protein [Gammaproteobacteria bacterium]
MTSFEPNFEDADAFYAALIDAHRDFSDAESEAMNARLILLLANEIGSREKLQAALDAARGSILEERS